MTHEKPSIGIKPEKLWLEARCLELAITIVNRLENPANARQECVGEWVAELQRHLATIRSME